MRKRIWRMSEDKFDNRKPKLDYDTDRVVLYGTYGQQMTGDFHFRSADSMPVKGIVYSSNPYVPILTPQFDGTDCTISFEVRGCHYHEGDSISGYFTICFNGGADRLPFDVRIISTKLMCSAGEIASLSDFAEFAKGHASEAVPLFYSQAFSQWIERMDPSVRILYEGYAHGAPSAANVEEFLVSAGVKPAILFHLGTEEFSFYDVTENLGESVLITKSAWGQLDLSVQTDAAFLAVEKDHISTESFLGSTMSFPFYIRTEYMHAGKNYGRIYFSSNGETKSVTVMATFDREDIIHEWKHRQVDHEKMLLTKTYEDYRFRRISTGDWSQKTVAILDDMLSFDIRNVWYRLLRAHAFIVNGQHQEGLWIIQDLKREIRDKFSRAWAYLLYLCTLIEREESYVNQLTNEIEEIYRFSDEDPVIFWLLTFLRKEYMSNHRKKFSDISRWIRRYPSPFFLIEGYSIVLQDPYLLEEFDDVTTKILYWAAKRDLYNRDIAMQIGRMLEKETTFSEHVFYIAKCAYEVYSSDEIFASLISYLLRQQVYGQQFLTLYTQAIDRDLRLTGLFEAYMMSTPDAIIGVLPYRVMLYFQYNCQLPYPKKALLYANVITHRRKYPKIYEQYFRSIEEFALEQMRQNHIDDALSVIYQNVLDMGVVDEGMAQAAAGILFMKKLSCQRDDITRVIVYQQQYEVPMVVPLLDGMANIPIVSKHFQVFLETKDGVLLSDKTYYKLERYIDPTSYIEKLKTISPLTLGYILYELDQVLGVDEMSSEDIAKVMAFLSSSLVSVRYKESRYPLIIALLRKYTREELLEDYFRRSVHHDRCTQEIRDYILEQMLIQKEYERAYEFLSRYYGLDVSKDLLLEMCSELLLLRNFTKDDFLLSLCAYLAAEGYATASTIVYLSTHQVAQTEWMLLWWQKARQLQIMVQDLEESLLFQGLYTGEHLAEMLPVFESYLSHGKDKMLIEAYVNYFSHAYLLAREDVPEQFFTYLAFLLDRGEQLKDSANLSYIKFLSTVDLLTDKEFAILDTLLQTYLLRNIYFAFYSNLDQRLLIRYHLYDKCFVEYRGNSGDHITMRYHIDDGKTQEDDLIEMYEGIFVKQLILFYGETLTYQLYSSEVTDAPLMENQMMISTQTMEDHGDRYDRINRMQNELMFSENDKLIRDLKNYQGLDVVCEKLFTTV